MNTLGRFASLSFLLVCSTGFIESAAAQISPLQHVTCSAGYTPTECHAQAVVLHAALKKYATRELGDWTWIVVRSYDWKNFLSVRKLPPDIPAFTYLPERETYFDEALFQVLSPRGLELSASWQMTIPQLLDLAIRHEMGHALCKERDEEAAKRTAQRLLETPSAPAQQACHSKKPNA